MRIIIETYNIADSVRIEKGSPIIRGGFQKPKIVEVVVRVSSLLGEVRVNADSKEEFAERLTSLLQGGIENILGTAEGLFESADKQG
ncbi:MAG: hypothetical protein Q8L89_04250 [Gammaproteobacteria bacterium]|nr:hypothetical protein [Gammaproteobacteria bacterium]